MLLLTERILPGEKTYKYIMSLKQQDCNKE